MNILKRSTMINGYSSIMITKLDILSSIGRLKILLANGEFKEVEGWTEDISGVRSFNDLPHNAKEYIHFIEQYLEVPVSWIGVGPERDAVIQKI